MITAAAATAYARPVFLDYASLTHDGEGDVSGAVLQWLRTSPCRSSIHVVLPSRLSSGRMMKNQLQALGCTVTWRMQ